jgi:predicted AlkP superfamily phosphohydrolase/phosphomutase
MRLPVARTAAVAGSLLAADVAVLTLFLNPEATLRRDGVALLVAFFLPHALAGAVAFAMVGLLAGWLLGDRVSRALVGPRLPHFVLLVGTAILAACALYGANLWSYRYSIPVASVRGLLAAAISLGAAWVVLAAVAADALLFTRHDRGPSAALLVLAAASAVALPLALRPAPEREPAPVPLVTERLSPARRVVLIGVDGVGQRELQAEVRRGAAPAWSALLRKGAHGPLGTLRPTEGPPLWTTVFTGRLPRHHGIKSFVSYRLPGSASAFDILPKWALVGALEKAGLVSTRPVTSADRRRRALWGVTGAFGLPAGIVRFWGTYPAEHGSGFMLSHTFHQLLGDPAALGLTLHPLALLPEVRARAVTAAEVDRALVAEFLEPTVPATDPRRRMLVENALAPDLTYQRAGQALRRAYAPAFFATSFNGLDVVGHGFLRYDQPESFGDVTPEEARRFGRVRARYLEMLAGLIAEEAQSLGTGDLLLVVSAYGMEPVSIWRRLLWPDRRSGSHADAPDGLVLALGSDVRAGSAVSGASILDVAPTLLYALGLPVARDMEGRVLSGLFEDDFVRAHPLTFIPSYESLAVAPPPASAPPALPPEEER